MNLNVMLLTECEQRIVRQVLNHFCAGDTPIADEATLPYFRQVYIVSTLRRALHQPALLTADGVNVVGAVLDKLDPQEVQR